MITDIILKNAVKLKSDMSNEDFFDVITELISTSFSSVDSALL